jgi:RimJ/RimL family protein N-acetyltransferase
MFETKRLRVRRLTPDDFDAMYAVYSDRDAMRWVDDGQPICQERCRQWIEVTQQNYARRGYGMSTAELLCDDSVVGFCGLVHPRGQATAEVKYALLRTHWGQGFATEMAQGMIDFGHQQFGIKQIIATIARENVASQRVIEKVGMQCIESREEDDGTLTDVFEWTPE